MGYDDYKEGVKKRRHERLQLLRKKQRVSSLRNKPSSISSSVYDKDSGDSTYSAYLVDKEEGGNSSTVSFLIKVVCSVFLLAGTYMVMKSESTQLTQAQDFIQEVMVREFNVQGIMSWYEKQVGEMPVFLPQLINRTDSQKTNPMNDYIMPVSGGKVMATFGQDQQGITVGTSAVLPIEVVKEGWVTFVGKKEGLAQTIVIEHGNGEESWYGQLQDSRVQLNDWVKQGQVIGSTTVYSDSGQGIFYFALRKNSVFVDPMEVMSFD